VDFILYIVTPLRCIYATNQDRPMRPLLQRALPDYADKATSLAMRH
jgi:hypothetical protein